MYMYFWTITFTFTETNKMVRIRINKLIDIKSFLFSPIDDSARSQKLCGSERFSRSFHMILFFIFIINLY